METWSMKRKSFTLSIPFTIKCLLVVLCRHQNEIHYFLLFFWNLWEMENYTIVLTISFITIFFFFFFLNKREIKSLRKCKKIKWKLLKSFKYCLQICFSRIIQIHITHSTLPMLYFFQTTSIYLKLEIA